VVAEIEGYECHAGLNEPTGQQRLLAPEVSAITIADGLRFLGDIKGIPGALAKDKLDSLLSVVVHRFHRPRRIEVAPQAIKVLDQRPPLVNTLEGQRRGSRNRSARLAPPVSIPKSVYTGKLTAWFATNGSYCLPK